VTVVVRQGAWSGVTGKYGDGTFTENVNAYNRDYSTNNNEFVLDDNGSGILKALGLVDSAGVMQNKTDAADAILVVNGITVTRSENTIEDLIAGVKLELVGLGDVTMNITQDTQKAVEAVQAFTDAYNETMTWINEKLDEKYSKSTADESDDYIQNLISSSKGTTVFGALHGDQLLWSIKNQLRNMMANSVASASRGIASKKYSFTDTDLNLNGEFYIYASCQALKIKVEPGDSLEDIRDKIANSFSITSKNGRTVTGDDLKLNVYIRDGQLVIDYNSASALTSPRTDVIARNHLSTDGSPVEYDLLQFTATKEAPVSGTFSVTMGETVYREGIDYEIVNVESSPGVLESRVKWLNGGNKPADNASYSVTYEYNPAAVAVSVISGADDINTLDFHVDQSKSQLSKFGLKTTSDDYGKSGLLDFDSDTLLGALTEDSNNTSNVLTGFFRGLDTYIGNLVDSSQYFVGGTAVTKGRIAGAMLSIDVEVETLNSQITKLERQLADRQTAMYKQYSDMELAIQKLNSQMSSLSQYISSTSSG
jgi:flagellar hook-associated protein 2